MKNGHTDICHLSYLDDISPKQRDSGLWKEKDWGKKAQQIAIWLRIHSQKWCSSPSPSHGLQSDFLSPVSFAHHTALGSRCHYSHLTGEKGGIVAIQWICVSDVRSRQRDQAQDSPAHCTATTMSPGIREGDFPMVGWDGTSQHTHHLGLGKSD